MSQPIQPSAPALRDSWQWLDQLKGIGLIAIFLVHATERLFKGPMFSNPTGDWPPLADRIAQMAPLTGFGAANIPLNLLRYVGWMGDQGVQLFLITSGFGLTWSLLRRRSAASISWPEFYQRRLFRLYPLWWAAHVFVLALQLVTRKIPAASLVNPDFYLSAIGIRFTRELFYVLSPSWWFIGLLIQLYLIFPLLWRGFQKLGATRFLLIVGGIALALRGLGLFTTGEYVEYWSRGSVFIARLPEFVLGMSLAGWFFQDSTQTDRTLRSWPVQIAGVLAYGVGLLGAFTLLGMTVSPFLLGLGLLILLYGLCQGPAKPWLDRLPLVWLGQHSYALFLVQHFFLKILVPWDQASLRGILGTVLAAGLAVLTGIGLEKVTDWFMKNRDLKSAISAIKIPIFSLLGLYTIGLGSEFLLRQFNPQEVNGWGEREAMQPDDRVGWKMKPSQDHHLRWDHYDYHLVTNSLGFVGPEYPIAKNPKTLRILTTGDAFTSAEGVNTDQSWVRLLEKKLAAKFPDRQIEIINFAITGHGPNQYLAAIQEFAPRYKPDLIISEFFVNDFEDAMSSNPDMQTSIGFQNRSPNHILSILSLAHLKQWLHHKVIAPPIGRLMGKPSPAYGYFLGHFEAMQPDRQNLATSQQTVADRVKQMKQVADQVGAKFIIPMVPSSIQVCAPQDLPYYPRNVDVKDYDLDQPQRSLQGIAAAQQVPFYDLRPILKQQFPCPYHPANMHWLPQGHVAVADYLLEQLVSGGYLK
jgi:peptidoglycan/LPS O-acetylase OafA/YrhL/lysophospholipase L1-like esterase